MAAPVLGLHRVNLLLLLVVAGLVAVYHHELRWAAGELPALLSGEIGSAPERQLYVRGWQHLEAGELEQAGELLERAVAIDPTCEGAYWLGEYYLRAGREQDALRQLEGFIEIDPTIVGAHLRVAGIHESRGDLGRARAALVRGIDYFGSEQQLFVPHTDPEAGEQPNLKSERVYARYSRALELLERELAKLDIESTIGDES
jgi:tetratricopeptide (TPR) repeat protein